MLVIDKTRNSGTEFVRIGLRNFCPSFASDSMSLQNPVGPVTKTATPIPQGATKTVELQQASRIPDVETSPFSEILPKGAVVHGSTMRVSEFFLEEWICP